MTMQPIASSASIRLTASCNSLDSWWFIALSLSGRLMREMLAYFAEVWTQIVH
jgi:hypothetical protein